MRPYVSLCYLVSPITRHEMTWGFIETVMALWTRDIDACPTERQAIPLIEAAGWEYQAMRERMPLVAAGGQER